MDWNWVILKVLLKGVSFPSHHKFVENRKFQTWTQSWKQQRGRFTAWEKVVFKPWGINCCLEVTHFPIPCLWCVREIWDLNDSGFWSRIKQSERTGGHNNHQNWGVVQDLWSLDVQTRRQKWDRHCFWKLAFFLFEVFPQSNSPPMNSHKPAPPQPLKQTKNQSKETPTTLHTRTETPKQPKTQQKPQTLREFSNPHTSLLHVPWGEMGVLK